MDVSSFNEDITSSGLYYYEIKSQGQSDAVATRAKMAVEPKKVLGDPNGHVAPDLERLHDVQKTGFPLLELPQELQDMVFSHLKVKADFLHGPVQSSGLRRENVSGSAPQGRLHPQPHLVNVCRTSKKFHKMGVSYLYQDIEIEADRLAELARTLFEHPELAQETRRFSIDFWTTHELPVSDVAIYRHVLGKVLDRTSFEYEEVLEAGSEVVPHNLAILLFSQLNRLEKLCIRMKMMFTFRLSIPPASLPCLTEVQLHNVLAAFVPFRFCRREAEWFNQAAPNLSTLVLGRLPADPSVFEHAPTSLTTLRLSGNIEFPPNRIRPPPELLGITTLTIDASFEKHKLHDWMTYMDDLLRRCPDMRTLTIHLQVGMYRTGTTIERPKLEDVLFPCRESLRNIHILGSASLVYGNFIVETFQDFKNLENLTVATTILRHNGLKAGALNGFLESLPASLRCLDLRGAHPVQETEQQLTAFFEAFETGGFRRLPKFETLKLGMACSLKESAALGELRRACKKSSVELIISGPPS